MTGIDWLVDWFLSPPPVFVYLVMSLTFIHWNTEAQKWFEEGI